MGYAVGVHSTHLWLHGFDREVYSSNSGRKFEYLERQGCSKLTISWELINDLGGAIILLFSHQLPKKMLFRQSQLLLHEEYNET